MKPSPRKTHPPGILVLTVSLVVAASQKSFGFFEPSSARKTHPPGILVVLTVSFLVAASQPNPGFFDPPSSSCNVVTIFGLKTADCNGLGLLTIPKTLDRDLKVLKFAENQLLSLKTDEFQDYVYLQEIYVVRNILEMIYTSAFRGLYSLQILDLEGNRLKTIRAYFFLGIASVRILSLKSNPIQRIELNSFGPLVNLEELSLENCWISQIDPLLFSGLDRLTEINLINTELQGLPVEMKSHLPKSLRVFRLWKNSWLCDCHLRWLRQWLTASSVNWDFPHNTPSCFGPEILKGVQWKHLTPEQFACPSRILVNATSTSFEVQSGANVTIDCVVSGDPEPSVNWYKDSIAIDKAAVHLRRLKGYTKERLVQSSLLLSSVSSEDAGNYVCAAENPAGRSEVTFRVLFDSKPPATASSDDSGSSLSGNMEIFLGMSLGGTTLIAGLIIGVVCVVRKSECRKNPVHRGRSYKGSDRCEKITDNGSAVKTSERLCDDEEDDESAKEDVTACDQKRIPSTLQSLLTSGRRQLDETYVLVNKVSKGVHSDDTDLLATPHSSSPPAVATSSGVDAAQKPANQRQAGCTHGAAEKQANSDEHQDNTLNEKTPDLLSYDSHTLNEAAKRPPGRVKLVKVSFAENVGDFIRSSSLKRAQENPYARFSDLQPGSAKTLHHDSVRTRSSAGGLETPSGNLKSFEHPPSGSENKRNTIQDRSDSSSRGGKSSSVAGSEIYDISTRYQSLYCRGNELGGCNWRLDLLPAVSCPSLPKISFSEISNRSAPRTKLRPDVGSRSSNPHGRTKPAESGAQLGPHQFTGTNTSPERSAASCALHKSRSQGALHARPAQSSTAGRPGRPSSKSIHHQLHCPNVALPSSIVGITDGLYPPPPYSKTLEVASDSGHVTSAGTDSRSQAVYAPGIGNECTTVKNQAKQQDNLGTTV